MNQGPDKIFNTASPVSAFQFDERVASVFSDMIHRSVPGYEVLLHLIGCLASTHVQRGTRCYDLGCSLGAVSLVLQRAIAASECEIIAVDQSQAMVSRCQQNVSLSLGRVPIRVECADACTVSVENASLIVLNYTLQFIPPEARLGLIHRLYQGLNPGGVLVVSEKLGFTDSAQGDSQRLLYEQFKRSMGYSDLEISQKRTALENVLIPDSEEAHNARFAQAGFARSMRWFQALQFTSFLAWKS
ncbi:MAG: carboxy-S-adenosyl-L-methionine synthase CmoA [Sumerlaeia bacterium]